MTDEQRTRRRAELMLAIGAVSLLNAILLIVVGPTVTGVVLCIQAAVLGPWSVITQMKNLETSP